jgi:hypothetical protein
VRENLAAAALGEFRSTSTEWRARCSYPGLAPERNRPASQGQPDPTLGNIARVSDQRQFSKGGLLDKILKEQTSLEDYGIKLRVLNEQHALSVESLAGFVPETLAERYKRGAVRRVFILLCQCGIRRDDGREIPYSVVTGVESRCWSSCSTTA